VQCLIYTFSLRLAILSSHIRFSEAALQYSNGKTYFFKSGQYYRCKFSLITLYTTLYILRKLIKTMWLDSLRKMKKICFQFKLALKRFVIVHFRSKIITLNLPMYISVCTTKVNDQPNLSSHFHIFRGERTEHLFVQIC